MRTFALYDPTVRHKQACAWVLCEPVSDSYEIELAEWACPEDLPFLLGLFAQKGCRHIESTWAKDWVMRRVPPPNRLNIDEILSAWGIDEYYVPALLAATKGRSSDDQFLMEEIPSQGYRDVDLNRRLEAPEEFGTLLGRARRACGMTQTQLAEATGVQQAVISRIEGGKVNPTLETMEILARGCGRILRISLD